MCSRRLLEQRLQSKKPTTTQSAEIEGKRNDLYHHIKIWQNVQAFYMPGVLGGQGDASERHAACPEGISLFLPSGAPRNFWLSDLAEKEKRLCVAQADDALNELQRLLWITLGLWDYKYTQLGPSQQANTHARSMISRFKEKIDQVVKRYRDARTALLILDPTGCWSQHLLELRPEDVKGPGRGKDDESEGRRELSWIWLAAASGSGNVNTAVSEEEISDSEYSSCNKSLTDVCDRLAG